VQSNYFSISCENITYLPQQNDGMVVQSVGDQEAKGSTLSSVPLQRNLGKLFTPRASVTKLCNLILAKWQ